MLKNQTRHTLQCMVLDSACFGEQEQVDSILDRTERDLNEIIGKLVDISNKFKKPPAKL